MTIVQRMRSQLKNAMKARDTTRTGFLRYWIAQLTLATGAEVPDDEAIKKMRGILKEAKAGPTTFTPEELDLVREWLPASLTPEQIAEVLVPFRDQIKAAPKDGIAMGLAMKALAGKPVDSDEVKAAIAVLRK